MSEAGHDIHAHFPAHREALHALKLSSPCYRDLAERYHGLAHRIARIEQQLEAASDELLEELKKQRLEILDKVSAMISEKPLA